MRKNSYIFTAILAIVVSTGAWASTPTAKEAQDGTSHTVYTNAPIEGEASEGIAGVTYVNRVANRAGAAAQAAENHAAHASKSAYDAATAASNAQTSADAAATAANSITNGNGITIDTSEAGKKKITVSPKANAGISVDSSGVAVKPNTNKGISVDKDGVAVVANTNKGISVDANGVAVKAGTGIVVDANGVAVAGAGVTTLGGMYAPATKEEYMQTLAEIQNNGGDIYNLADQRTVALTVSLAAELAAQGTLSGVYSTIEDVPDMIPSKYEELQSRPLSAYAFWEGAASESAKQREISDYSYVNISDATKTSNHAVGDVARPVYVMDKETNGVHTGEVAPIQSVAIPVGSENFANTITSANVAKIWIQ